MILSYFKLAFRLIARNPFFSFIKIMGLAMGLAMFFILWEYTHSELHSDQQWKDAHRIYRFGTKIKWTDDKAKWEQSLFATNLPSLAEQIITNYSEIVESTRILSQQNFTATKESSCVKQHGVNLFLTAQAGANKFSSKETNLAYADPNVFTFFDLPLIVGEPKSALGLAGSIVLSRKLAVKYFGATEALGRTIIIDDHISLTVTGVFENLPRNTHLSFDALISSEGIKSQYDKVRADPRMPVHYIKVREGVNYITLCKKINMQMQPQIRKAYFGDWLYGDAEAYLQPLPEMPYQSYIADNYSAKSTTVLYIFQSAAISVILLALINYLNLGSAANLKRTKELATRRAIGAKAWELAAQFMVEAFVINTISFLLALTVVQLIKSPMETVFGFYVVPAANFLDSTVWIMTAVFVGCVFISGAYAAWIALKHNHQGVLATTNTKHIVSINWLTTLQYSVAMAIVVFAFIINEQLSYIFTRDIGFKKEEVLVVDLPTKPTDNFNVDLNSFIEKVRGMDASVSQSVPGGVSVGFINLHQPGIELGIGVEGHGGVDENYIPLYNIKILEGRNFRADSPTDSTAILLSEIASSRLGFEKAVDAIGRKVIAGINGKNKEVDVVGIFADYETRPALNTGVHQSKGLALTYKNYLFSTESWSTPHKVSFRIKAQSFKESINRIEAAYRESFSDPIFNWYFLDEAINAKYQQLERVGNQIMLFSLLSVGIACLGLLGMMAYKINCKIKEIGIHKVLGAQLFDIAQLLLKTTTKQIILACILGIPASIYLTQQYLENFSERIKLQWWHFSIPVVILILILMLTVTSVVYKAANSNLVDALKHE